MRNGGTISAVVVNVLVAGADAVTAMARVGTARVVPGAGAKEMAPREQCW